MLSCPSKMFTIFLILKFTRRAVQMTLLVKYLTYKHKDLGMNFKNTYEWVSACLEPQCWGGVGETG